MQKYFYLLITAVISIINVKETSAHPHMFIDISMKYMLNDSGVSGIYTYWDIDEMTSAQIVGCYDKNKNGIFEKQELIQILKCALPTIQNMTTISWGLNFYTIEKVERFNTVIKNKTKVIYSFFIPCSIPLNDIPDGKITVYFEDSTMYIAFTLNKKLIQVSSNKNIVGKIIFGKIDYIETVILHLQRN